MPSNDSIDEEEIHRFIDGELSSSQRSALQARLARDPARAAEVFEEASRMEALRASQSLRLFPKRVEETAARLENALLRRRLMTFAAYPVAAALLLSAGWFSHAIMFPDRSRTIDDNFVLAAREALRVAQLDAGPVNGGEHKHDKIERLVGAINIAIPPLPRSWQVIEVQVQPWEGRQSLVVTAATPSLGKVTLVAAPMTDEDAVPLTAVSDGRIPTVYWQSGGTAYALMGPAATERLKREAKEIEVSTRRNVGSKFRS